MGNCTSRPVAVPQYEMTSMEVSSSPFAFKCDWEIIDGRSRYFGLEVSRIGSPCGTWWIGGSSTGNVNVDFLTLPNVPSELLKRTVEKCQSYGTKLWAYRLFEQQYLYIQLSDGHFFPNSEELFKWSNGEWQHVSTHANGHFSWMLSLARVGDVFYAPTGLDLDEPVISKIPRTELRMQRIASDWSGLENVLISAPHLKGKESLITVIVGQWGSTLLVHTRGCLQDGKRNMFSFVDLVTKTCTPVRYQGEILPSITGRYNALGGGRVVIGTGTSAEVEAYFVVDIEPKEVKCLARNFESKTVLRWFDDGETGDVFALSLNLKMEVESLFRFSPLF